MNARIEKAILRTARWIGIAARYLARAIVMTVITLWLIPPLVLFFIPAATLGYALRWMVHGFHAGRRACDRWLSNE